MMRKRARSKRYLDRLKSTSRGLLTLLVIFAFAGLPAEAANDPIYPDEAKADLPPVTKTKINKVKIGLPDGWEQAPSEEGDEEAWIHARLKNKELNATLLVVKFPLVTLETQANFMQQLVDGSLPNHQVILGRHKLKKGLTAPLFAGYQGKMIVEGREVAVQMYVAYNIGQGMKVFGLQLIGAPDMLIQSVTEAVGEELDMELTTTPFEKDFVAILSSM